MSAFTSAELAYLGERRLARLATVSGDGVPHVTPVGTWSYSPDHDAVDVSGHHFDKTKKYRDVVTTGRAALVIDDIASTDPWRPRGVEIRGHAEAVVDPHPLIRIQPHRVISWGLDAPAE